MPLALKIDVISDVVCPWCFIGKRHLESALAAWRRDHPDAEQPVVRWHPFQLNPQLPRSGVPRADYIATKFGGPQRAKDVYARVANAGARAGIGSFLDHLGDFRIEGEITKACVAQGVTSPVIKATIEL